MRPEEFARHVALERHPVGEAVAPWAENHWGLAWDLPDGRWFASEVVPHPTANLTVERASHPRPNLPPGERVVVTGVATRRFDVGIRGAGVVHGVRFRPGGLAALTGHHAAGWTDRTVPAREVLPAGTVADLADDVLVDDPPAWREAAEAALAAVAAGRDPDPAYARLIGVVADMLEDRGLVTVADVAARHATSVRTLQRLFKRYVGVGPKWVLARYRMHDVVTALDAGYDGSLADLAHRHGWYDQAHFTRDFAALVGLPPGQYRDGRTGTA
ncbi:helix-turn-helix transcriptional regulator [Phycicoccus sp. CMS6Z-2]|uniref:Helix-turn-helix transcriptional regulator n=1 Tax=Phycicoccus flavus TaxID=2502783 RepID=A0A8T6R2J6_9MICO|nr:helix-turn-helix transcriptional regulator [Phycicoccus flavus]